MSAETHYYVQAVFGGGTDLVLFGHTENPWLAKQCYIAYTHNKFFLESYPSVEEAVDHVTLFEYCGGLSAFHQTINDLFGICITGEDIIDVFETDMLSDMSMSFLPKNQIVSTGADVLGGSFIHFAERFILPRDIMQTFRCIGFMNIFMTLTRDSFLPPDKIADLVLFIKVIKQHPLFSENNPPFIQDMLMVGDASFDMIRYGIAKGWYYAL